MEQAGGKKYDDKQSETIKARFEALDIDYSDGNGKKDDEEYEPTMDSEEKENLVFFYHPDHLGSTSYVTDADGNIAQHIEYIPYGEVFVEERNSQFSTNFLFNAKELDNETGLYYYGARYLDPTGAMWLSVDPLFEKYAGMSPYNYCAGNPVKLVDLDGREVGLDGEESSVKEYVQMLHDHTGNNYIVENGKLKNNGVDGSFKGAKSDKLAESIDNAISSSTQYNLTIVSESDDVFIDSYESKQIDISDLKKIGDASSAFQAAVIGHFVNEIQYGSFEEGHRFSLNFESEVFSEISGELVQARTDYQKSFF